MNVYKYNIMKKEVIVFLLMLFLPGIRAAAQNSNLEKLNTYKVGFFTKKLNLTTQEAERFWPVYNEYQTQKNQIQLDKAVIIRTFNQNEIIFSNEQLSELGDKLVATIVQESALAVALHKKLKEVLPPAKVLRFYQVENQYKAQLLNELQGIRQQQQQQRPLLRRNFMP